MPLGPNDLGISKQQFINSQCKIIDMRLVECSDDNTNSGKFVLTIHIDGIDKNIFNSDIKQIYIDAGWSKVEWVDPPNRPGETDPSFIRFIHKE